MDASKTEECRWQPRSAWHTTREGERAVAGLHAAARALPVQAAPSGSHA